MSDYTAKIFSPNPPDETATRIDNGLELWWSTRVDRNPNGFTIRFNRSHATFVYEPDSTTEGFVWTCTDANMIIDGVKDSGEWKGTRLIWGLQTNGGGTDVTLTHAGLNSKIECFEVCVRGWQHYFENSLHAYLNGQPASPETGQ